MLQQGLVIAFYAIATFCSLVSEAQNGGLPQYEVYPFDRGEILEYRLHYGWFNIGRATVQLDEEVHLRDGKSCFELRVNGGTAGLLNIFASVDDEWGALISEEDLTPVYTYRNIQEGKYQLQERVYIQPDSGHIRVESYRPRKDKRTKDLFTYDPQVEMYDMLSGILVMRNLDFTQYDVGDTIQMDTFFEDTFYHFKIIYGGVEMVKTGVGELRGHKVVPVMPDNSVFDGENSVTAWFSADRNQLPLKVTADMFIGKASCEIASYKNIKNGPDYQAN